MEFRDIVEKPPSEVHQLFYDGVIDRNLLESYSSYHDKQKRSVIAMKSREDGNPTPFAPKGFVVDVILKILEGDCKDYKSALRLSAKSFNKTEEWLNIIKGKKFKMIKQVLDQLNGHPQRKVMEANGTWDQIGFKRSGTVNSLAKNIYKAKRISDTLEILKEAVADNTEKINYLLHKTNFLEAIVSRSDEYSVLMLHLEGLDVRGITKATGFSKSKVYRILKGHK